jgi:GTP-binding protein
MKTPVVVIVGRPNVGKSTLFNRLLGKREAIVDDISGVTRDRNYGDAEWNGKEFKLIDTGGYVPDSSDLFETAIREQIEIAVSEADSIIFMVDVRTGINPIDIEIGNRLRSSGKDFFLLVNKVDSPGFEPAVSEFFKLGVERIYDVSALAGRKIGDFLDDLTEEFKQAEKNQSDEDKRLKIAIVGRPNVGKSSLTNALLGFDRSIVTEIPGTTRDSVDSILKYQKQEIVLIDTAGLRKKKRINESIEFFSAIRTLRTIGECDVTIIMLDAMIGIELQDQKIIDEAVRRRKGIILAVNKWDLVEKESSTAKSYEDAIKNKMGNIDYVPIIFISALTKQRIYKLIDMALSINEERKKKIPTSELNDSLIPWIQKNPPPATKTGKEVKIKYVTQGGDHYPVFIFFTNYPKEVQDNYKRFLEKLIRDKYGFKGVPFTLSFRNK